MEVLLGQGLRLASTLGSSPAILAKSFTKSAQYSLCTGLRFGASNVSEWYPRPRILSYEYSSRLSYFTSSNRAYKTNNNNGAAALMRYYSTQQPFKESCKQSEDPEKKVSLVQKMKQMTKDYWYILVPVHLVTSAGWVAIFYIPIKNGVDIAALLEYIHIGEDYIDKVRNSRAGVWALVYLLYKIFTPLRYTVTLGGTTMVISKLNKRGILKASQLKQGLKDHQELKKPVGATLQIKCG